MNSPQSSDQNPLPHNDEPWIEGSPRTHLEPGMRVKVWDILIRLFHWSLAVSFITGYYITDQFPLHAYSGYAIFCLVVIRIIWGFVGTSYARFSAFSYTFKETLQYMLSAIRMGEAREYLSHNPMGAIMVFTMLVLLAINATLGIMLYAAQQLEGPLQSIIPTSWEDPLLIAHAMMAKLLMTLAAIHVLGVFWASWWHRQNYVWAMITGYKSAYTRRSRRRREGDQWNEQQRSLRTGKPSPED